MRKIDNRIKTIGLVATFLMGYGQHLYAADKWQEGTAAIGPNNEQKICPVGASATAREPGCSHDVCTSAKQQSAANLRAQYSKCGKYIRPIGRCLNGPGCKK